jgi:ubiquinone/menaquinone biosynthesis C-methylase UbiE
MIDHYNQSAALGLDNAARITRHDWRAEDFVSRRDETVVNLFDFKLSKEDVFVDLGFGIGHTIKLVAPYVKEYIGIDPAQNQIETAKSLFHDYNNVNFVLNDGESIPLEDNSVDVLISEQVLQHVLEWR